MATHYLDVLFTPTVLEAQRRYLGRSNPRPSGSGNDPLTAEETAFIESRDSFYLATVSESGWPYVQHRGGPPGFLRVLNPSQLAFADYPGNRQFLSTGNLGSNDRVSLFLMDYARRERLKILGRARVQDVRGRPDLLAGLPESPTRQPPERLFLIEVVSYDWNCPQYITPRYTAAEVEAAVAPLHARIAELEAKLQ